METTEIKNIWFKVFDKWDDICDGKPAADCPFCDEFDCYADINSCPISSITQKADCAGISYHDWSSTTTDIACEYYSLTEESLELAEIVLCELNELFERWLDENK